MRRAPVPVVAGEKLGRLTVVGVGGVNKRGRKLVAFTCDCGAAVEYQMTAVSSGNTLSCGCLRRDLLAAKNFKHGHRVREEKTGVKTRTEYTIWKRMRTRCNDESDRKYPAYGGRGIKCCDRWNDFELFLSDMGERPSLQHSLDRIDNNGNYEPGNVRWATASQQARNKRNSRFVEFEGKLVSLADLVERFNVRYGLVSGRLGLGWPIERAISEPVQSNKRKSNVGSRSVGEDGGST